MVKKGFKVPVKLANESVVIMLFGSLFFFYLRRPCGEGGENATKFCFMANILQSKVAKRQFYEKIEPGALHGCS